MLLDVGAAGHTGERAATLLLERGLIAATPILNWGIKNGPQFIHFVFSNEPVDRLRGIGGRGRRALT